MQKLKGAYSLIAVSYTHLDVYKRQVLEQIEKTEETYHCYITIDKEKAMQAAKEAQLSLIHI